MLELFITGLVLYLSIVFYKPLKVLAMVFFVLLCRFFVLVLGLGIWPIFGYMYWYINIRGLK